MIKPHIGLVHAPFSLLPARFPASFWKQACELAPIFNELVDRVSLDGEFLQAALSRQVLNSIHWILLVPMWCKYIFCSEYTLSKQDCQLIPIHNNVVALNFEDNMTLC